MADLSAVREIFRLALEAIDAQMAAPTSPPAPPVVESDELPSIVMPEFVDVDPQASVANVEVRLSKPPTTTVRIPVMTRNGEGSEKAWEGGQYGRLSTVVTFDAGGPQAQTVAVPLIPKPGNAGKWFEVYTNIGNLGVAHGAASSRVRFVPGAENPATPYVAPPKREPQKGELVYSLEPKTFQAKAGGGPGIWDTGFHSGIRTQDGNGEVGLYTDPELHAPARSWFIDGEAVALQAEKLATPITFRDRAWAYSASVLRAPWLARLYGYFEFEAQSTAVRGSWPAAWLLPADDSWPPELDVFEHPRNGAVTPTDTTFNQHWTADGKHRQIAGATLPVGKDLTADFHTYGIDWREDVTTWFLDDEPIFTTPTRVRKPCYPLLDVAVGGWAGDPSGLTSAVMLVRGVRVYA